MTEQEQPKKKRRRRRRRGRGRAQPSNDLRRAEESEADDQDDGLSRPTPRETFSVTCEIPVRWKELLEWLAKGTGQTPEQMASRLLIDSLAPNHAKMRDYLAGDAAATVSKDTYERMRSGL